MTRRLLACFEIALTHFFQPGLIFFVLANFWGWFMHSSSRLSEDWIDGIHGLLIGIAIGGMLIGFIRSRRTNCGAS